MKASPTSSPNGGDPGSPGESGNRHRLQRCEPSSQRCWRRHKKRLADALRAAYAQADAAVCTIQAAYYRYHKKVSPRFLSLFCACCVLSSRGHPPATIVTPDAPRSLATSTVQQFDWLVSFLEPTSSADAPVNACSWYGGRHVCSGSETRRHSRYSECTGHTGGVSLCYIAR